MSTTDWAVIPVAGRGTRMAPITRVIPKELLPLGRKPALHWIVEELLLAGFRHLVFVTSTNKDSVRKYLEDEQVFAQLASVAPTTADTGCPLPQFYFVDQPRPRGLGDAVRCAQDVVGCRRFAVALGDCVLGARIRSDVLVRMAAQARAAAAEIVIAFQRVPPETVSRYGIAEPAHEGDTFDLLDLVEKPRREQAPSNLAVAGRYLLPGEVFESLGAVGAGVGDEIQLTDALRGLIRAGRRAAGVVLQPGEQRYDVGDFPSYFRAFAAFAAVDADSPDGVPQY